MTYSADLLNMKANEQIIDLQLAYETLTVKSLLFYTKGFSNVALGGH